MLPVYYIVDTLLNRIVMAKKDKKGFRIPKEIGGMKVPKEARRAGEALLEKASSPSGRQALASGFAMAAAAATAAAARQGRDHAKAEKSADTADDRGGTVDPSRVADALGDAASAFMSSLFSRHKPNNP